MRPATAPLSVALALAAWGALAPAGAAAQTVVVFRIEPGAEALCAQVEQALQGMNVMPDPGYYQEATSRSLDPASEQAMTELTPLVGADLAIVPLGADDQAMSLSFRDGHSGRSLGELEVPLASGMLGFVARQQLQRETRTRLASLGGGAAPAPAPAPRGAPAGAGTAPGGSTGGAWSAGGATTGYVDTGEGEEAEPEGGEDTAIDLELHAGAGMGMRAVEWPTAAGRDEVDLGAFPALEVGAAVWFVPDPGFAIGGVVDYQSSFGHEIDEQHGEGASARPMAIRSHRLGATLLPEFRFGDDHDIRLGLGLGYGLRSLRPAVHHLLTPDFSIGGPTVKLALRIPLSDDVAVVLAPEGQLVVQVSDELQVLGVEGSGIAFGGEAAVSIHIDGGFSMQLTFRESHASLGSRLGDDASDVERFATARLSGVL